MARLLQRLSPRLLALVLAMAAAYAAPEDSRSFSHRVHLKLKLECVSCHASATSSARVEDNNLPAKEVCLRCHEQATIKSPRLTMVARFSHAQHLKLGNVAKIIAAAIDRNTYLSPADDIRRHLNTANACVACHRGLEESDAVTAAAYPQMADCLVCHSKIEPPFSCELCHTADQKLKPDSHTPDYIDLHSSGKIQLDKPSCAVCHGRKFRCLGCH